MPCQTVLSLKWPLGVTMRSYSPMMMVRWCLYILIYSQGQQHLGLHILLNFELSFGNAGTALEIETGRANTKRFFWKKRFYKWKFLVTSNFEKTLRVMAYMAALPLTSRSPTENDILRILHLARIWMCLPVWQFSEISIYLFFSERKSRLYVDIFNFYFFRCEQG